MSPKQFAINAHASTNHMYDKYLPYEFHLRMVVEVYLKFYGLIHPGLEEKINAACWLHDTIEDCRVNYAEIKQEFGEEVAEIVRACTNYTRGRNKKERIPDYIYDDISNVPGAAFVKLCDRIANVQYSKMTGSSMFEKYKNEHAHFSSSITAPELGEMWMYLDELLHSR